MSQQSQKSANKSKNNAFEKPGISSQIEVEDHETLPASQISPNRNLSDQEEKRFIANVVKYILAADHTKIPIIKTSISKYVNCHNKNFKKILTSAIQILKDVFGYHVEDVDGKLIVTNLIKNNLPHLEYEEHETTRYIILFLMLSHIYMCGGYSSQGSLIDFLMQLNIVTDGNMKNDLFGDISLLINEFVKEKYLVMTSKEHEGSEPEYRWGLRAENELSPRTILEFVSKVYRNRDMQFWPQQYERMLEIERKAYKKAERLQDQNGAEENMEE